MVVNHSVAVAAHCINPDCSHPYPQSMANNFCNSCGSPLRLKNRYIPLQRLGVGGFAAIYAVWDISAQTELVLKVLVETSPKALELFEQEAKVLASLRHPGVPLVEPDDYFQIVVGNSPQRLLPCLVMEKIAGQTLEEILELYPQGCPPEWVLSWLKQAVDILRELHRRRIVHRDIKPSNLMLRHHAPLRGTQLLSSPGKKEKGQLVLIDFGGAKQIGLGIKAPIVSNSQGRSTRLFSPGYSPPEQMTGGVVEPGADFYALGMTCIHLLTGIFPPELEDPVTGALRWRDALRDRILIHPEFADLLDEMISPDLRDRPASASKIRARILRINRQKVTSRNFILLCLQWCFNSLWAGLVFVCRVIYSAFRLIFQVLSAGINTILAMAIGGLGGFAGSIGFWLAHKSPLMTQMNNYLTQDIPRQLPDIAIIIKPEIILFAAAGWTTASSLSRTSSLGTCGGFWAGWMGMLGYILGWLLWQAVSPDGAGLVGGCAIAAYFLTVGLGLPRQHILVYAIVAATGTAGLFASLVTLNLLPNGTINSLADAFSQWGWSEPGISLAFFSILGIILGFWLSVSHHIVVPLLRLLGWR
ncbi:serine/threonine protein kinase [Microseira sp. BLCC-F43]|uniref:serine/threonine protein kinase n=1 Tax=Microseira sp. BLCC-F43 TaxID=3153602 RepID=UPI0035B712AF